MPVYVSLVKFTQERIRTMKDEGIARSEAAKKIIEDLGGKLLNAYYCLGEYDIVAILEFPDNHAATEAASRNAALGNIVVHIMPAVPRDEWAKMLHQVWRKE
jgi:uncharacterized protein with GYD domain